MTVSAIAPPTSRRMFKLFRHRDVSGISGTGMVAEGVQFSDGTVALRWYGEWASTNVWPCIEAVIAVHGHGGATEVIWDDGPQLQMRSRVVAPQ